MKDVADSPNRFTWRGRLPVAAVPILVGPLLVLMFFLEPETFDGWAPIGLLVGAVVSTLAVRALRGGIQVTSNDVVCRRACSTKRFPIGNVAGFEASSEITPPMWIPSPWHEHRGVAIKLKDGKSYECPYIYGPSDVTSSIVDSLRADLRQTRFPR